jgi:phosphatidylinositol alpha-mannosyltransferase
LVPVLPYMVLLNSGATNIATFHAFRHSSAWYTALKPYMNLLLSRLDARIAVSGPALEFVSQYFEGPYEVIPNGIDVARFLDPEPLPWANDGRPRILFVGRFTEPARGSSTCYGRCRSSTSSSPTPVSSWLGPGGPKSTPG